MGLSRALLATPGIWATVRSAFSRAALTSFSRRRGRCRCVCVALCPRRRLFRYGSVLTFRVIKGGQENQKSDPGHGDHPANLDDIQRAGLGRSPTAQPQSEFITSLAIEDSRPTGAF